MHFLPVNSLTSAFDCFVFMLITKRHKIIHCDDLVCVDFRCAVTWPLIDGQPILNLRVIKKLFLIYTIFFSLLEGLKENINEIFHIS